MINFREKGKQERVREKEGKERNQLPPIQALTRD